MKDSRQRDQIKQALRSHKQNIVEGSSERSLSSKLKLYDVANASGMEALEDFEDILRLERFPRWSKDDLRLAKLRQLFEGFPNPSLSSSPSVSFLVLKEGLGGIEEREGLETAVNYLIDLLIRSGYLLDKQINAVEKKHETEGGYREKLLQRRLSYRQNKF